MIFLSAGHHNADPGAVGNGFKEADLCKELRGLIAKELDAKGYSYVLDKDSETLAQYTARIKPGSGSVVCEIHFNASANAIATGTEVLYPGNGSKENIAIAKDMSAQMARVMGIRDRGGKSESESARGRLAILRTGAGLSFLPEIGFISNKDDVAAYQKNKVALAKVIACQLAYAEDLKQ